MSNQDFLIYVQSSLEKMLYDLVSTVQAEDPTHYADLEGMDVNDIVDTDQLIKSTRPLLLWEVISVSPYPRDPLYKVEFAVGAKTLEDKSNFRLTDLSSRIQQEFRVDSRIALGDYSGASADLNKGYLSITGVALAPQVFDNVAGIRMWQVEGLGARFL